MKVWEKVVCCGSRSELCEGISLEPEGRELQLGSELSLHATTMLVNGKL